MGAAAGPGRRRVSAWRVFAGAVLSLLAITAASANGAPTAPDVSTRGEAQLVPVARPGIDVGRVVQTVRENTGTPLPSGRLLEGDQVAPAVVFGGANYLVAWQDYRTAPFKIYAARVSPAGAILDPGGILISTNLGEQRAPAIGFDGTNYFVVWDTTSDVYGARVTQAGALLDRGGVPISTAPDVQAWPVLAFDGTNYLVAWQDGRPGGGIYGARVNGAGTVLDPGGFAISSGSAGAPAVAFDGANYLVTWEDGRQGVGNIDIYGTRVTTGGNVLEPDGIQISSTVGRDEAPGVAFDGANCLVVWGHDSGFFDITGARVTPAGVVLDPTGIAISTVPGDQRRPGLVFDGSNYLVAWDDARSGNYEIYGARVSSAGVVADPGGIPVSTGTGNRFQPVLAFDGADTLVVWDDSRAGNRDIYGARLTQAGIVLDRAGILISTEPQPRPPPPPPPLDTERPHIHALKSKGRQGDRARLKYTVWDDSSITRTALVVFVGKQAVAAGSTRYGRVRRGVVYAAIWRVPRKKLQKVKFCVQATDRAGNRSKVSCAKVVIT
jgi:hypothetical protein